MGKAVEILNAEEVAEGAPDDRTSGIPSSHLTVDHTLSIPEMKPHVVELCKDLFKKWSNLDDSHFSVETLSGGITNLLLKVSVREENGETVNLTVRLYGPNTDYVIDRERELQAIQYLSAAGFGAKLFGVFKNGMVQSFIHARTLAPSDMRKPKLAAEIAKKLHEFHQVEIPGPKEPQLWNEIIKFFRKASTLQFDDSESQRKYVTVSFEEVHNEITELKELTGHLNAPVVFAHNDLLCGNLMHNEDEGKLYFIDFEYGSYNYRGFDIGNHFNEYAGYECDYSLYPTKTEQYHFFRYYLKPHQPNEVSEEDLEALYVETNTYMLASHLCWGLWGLIQAKISPIDFDYLGYFFWRYTEYKKQKEKCFTTAKAYLAKSKGIFH
ncbi:PREDICTED: probable ethanolamine kinase [Ipomoea nil]|uniref:probable ethanolamine kinase n=1 Tax=Ipomoea nil TaxID=35883 RepID=UPI000900DD07|nr:PREDICTED: probable ethanolamine kinase [Ipomoea nil]